MTNQLVSLTENHGRASLSTTMDAMERCRRRLQILMDERTSTGKLRQKAFARHMNKSEAWLSNVLSGKRGLRIVDLDKVADFFRLPVSELVRESDAELVEVTPSEQSLLRKVRRMNKEYRDGIYLFAGLPQPATVETDRAKTIHTKKPAPRKDSEK